MTVVSLILLLLPAALVLYAYVVYPLILAFLARRRKVAPATRGTCPVVSIVVPAYNEEGQIRGAIEALLGQDYPADLRQILIVSDASTDRTDDIVSEYRDRGVELLRMPVRGGKTAAENASCARLRGEIIINSDSSVRLHRSAVRRLVDAMADPDVGVASTRDVSVGDSEATSITEGGYVSYEMRVRQLETRTGGIVGASGSGYAILRNLHLIPIRSDLSRDFSAALTARRYGFATVSVEDALCYVPRTTSLPAEYRRKVRTIARGAETLFHNNDLLDPTQFGVFAWKLLSHKVCRWLAPPSAVLGAIGLAVLATQRAWLLIPLAFGVALLVAAALGAVWPANRPIPRVLFIVTFAVAANVAVIHALFRIWRGHQDHLWEPTRRAPTNAST